MDDDWRGQILARFPDWSTDEALARWPIARAGLSQWQQVQGVVIARVPFGVWVDIEAGNPALLLVTEMARAADQRITFSDYPAIGANLTATIVAIGDRAEIALSQFPSDSSCNRSGAFQYRGGSFEAIGPDSAQVDGRDSG